MFNYSHVIIFGFKFVKGFYYSLQLQNSISMFLILICKERLIVMYNLDLKPWKTKTQRWRYYSWRQEQIWDEFPKIKLENKSFKIQKLTCSKSSKNIFSSSSNLPIYT
jgi:hypothetical protein